MIWELSHSFSDLGREIADRHYNRQKPGSPRFAPPGRCLVLRAEATSGKALWVTSWPFAEYTRHEWAGAWICSTFRNEGAGVASELIRDAVAATLAHYGNPPPLGMVTFVDPKKVRPAAAKTERDFVGPVPIYGQVFRQAGFKEVGRTKVNDLIALQLLPQDMPDAAPWAGMQELWSYTLIDFHNESGLDFSDISSEQERVYDFGERGTVLIDAPLKLNVSDSGGHRILDAAGVSHYIPAGWIHLSWIAKVGEPHFVR